MGKLITYNTAVLAKEKGFDIFTDECFYPHENFFKSHNYRFGTFGHDINVIYNKTFDTKFIQDAECWTDEYFYAPTKEELKTWLRKEHNIDVTVSVHGDIDLYVKDSPLLKTYTARVDNWNVRWSVHDGTGFVMPEHYHFKGSNYNDAFEQGLYKALELI